MSYVKKSGSLSTRVKRNISDDRSSVCYAGDVFFIRKYLSDNL